MLLSTGIHLMRAARNRGEHCGKSQPWRKPMAKISENECFYRCLDMFHSEGGPKPSQLNSSDEIEGSVLGYNAQRHRALSGRINNKYYADVEAATKPVNVQGKKTIGALSDYIFTTIPDTNKHK